MRGVVRYPVAEKIVIQRPIFGVSTSFVVFSLLLPSLAFFFLYIQIPPNYLLPLWVEALDFRCQKNWSTSYDVKSL